MVRPILWLRHVMLKSLGRFLELRPVERRLLIHAALVVAVVQLVVRFLPARYTGTVLTRAGRIRKFPNPSRPTPEAICWAIAAVARRLSGATCLARALAAQWVLASNGYASSVQLGVSRGPGGGLTAHAWLERDGVALFGLDDPESYKLILSSGGVLG